MRRLYITSTLIIICKINREAVPAAFPEKEKIMKTLDTKKKKIFYRILRSDTEVNAFYDGYALIKQSYPAIKEAIRNSTLKLHGDSTANATSILEQQDIIKAKIEKQKGIATSSLTYHRNHPDETALSDEAVSKLKEVLADTKNELADIDFMVEQAKDLFALTSIPDTLRSLAGENTTDTAAQVSEEDSNNEG
jgi:hypothetical protein